MLSEVHDVDSDDEDRKRREEQYREMVEREKQERKLELNKWKVGESNPMTCAARSVVSVCALVILLKNSLVIMLSNQLPSTIF